MSTVTKPVILDETGQLVASTLASKADAITEKLNEIKNAITEEVVIAPISLSITSYPTRTDYLPGENLDLTGLVVKALFSNGNSYDVTQNCTITPDINESLTTDVDTVTITWSYTPTGQTLTTRFSIFVGICEWSSGTPAQIQLALDAHYNGIINLHNYWNVGDERIISLSAMAATGVGESHDAQNVVFVLTEEGGKYLEDGVTECVYQVDQRGCLSEGGYINSTETISGGWRDCARRTWCNNVYRNAIPSDERSLFKEFINYSGTGISSSGTYQTKDYFALRAEIEIYGNNRLSVEGEGSQIEYYETTAHRKKNNSPYWLRSPGISESGNKWVFASPGNDYALMKVPNDDDELIAPFGVI